VSKDDKSRQIFQSGSPTGSSVFPAAAQPNYQDDACLRERSAPQLPVRRGAGGLVVCGDVVILARIGSNIFYIPHASEADWWKLQYHFIRQPFEQTSWRSIMGETSVKRSLSNRTDSRKKHQIRYLVSSQGRVVSDLKTLKAGESIDLEDGDRLIIISDRKTNYAIRLESGALLGVEQVNNNHSKFPDSTVAAYSLLSNSNESGETDEMTLQSDRGEDDPENGNGPVIIVVTEPEQPEP
jgi:hypothetical protein